MVKTITSLQAFAFLLALLTLSFPFFKRVPQLHVRCKDESIHTNIDVGPAVSIPSQKNVLPITF